MNSTSTLSSVPLHSSIPRSNAETGENGRSQAIPEARVSAATAELDERSKQQIVSMYGIISEEMQQIERRFHAELQSPYESLVPVLRHGTQLGGKRLRPAMLLLSGTALGPLTPDHIILGTVVEMVHTATLIHDDVLDEAEMRRHSATVNAKWNNHTSILLGDYLFAQSFRLVATIGSIEACQWLGESSRLICEGEMRQILTRDVLDLDESTYLEMIQGKTAELCRVACRLGAKFSGGGDVDVDALADYGDSLGIAFQIADDYLDLWGSDQRVGKTLGTDIEQGKTTLPIIRMLCTARESERERIASLLLGPSEHRLKAIMPFLEQSDAKAYTRSIAEAYRSKAIESISHLADSQAKQALISLANFAVDRRF